jgi:hypothetical protein
MSGLSGATSSEKTGMEIGVITLGEFLNDAVLYNCSKD